jgi:hypothetical protein
LLSAQVLANTTILELKHRIFAQTGVETMDQVLQFAGWLLANTCTVDDYNLMDGTMLHMVLSHLVYLAMYIVICH